MLKRIIKRDGTVEDFMPLKLIKWVQWSARFVKKIVDWEVIVSQVVRESPEEMSSQDLQLALIEKLKATGGWSELMMAGCLYAAYTHKKMYDGRPPTLLEMHMKLHSLGLMSDLFREYTAEEYAEIEKMIDHGRDSGYAEFQISQDIHKYAIRNEMTKEAYETPQFIAMRMAMALSYDEPKEKRLEHIKEYYYRFSTNRINAPSPNYLNLGTKHRGYASCCVIKAGDTLPSIGLFNHIAFVMTGQSAGIGGTLAIRSEGDPVRGGRIIHTGKYGYSYAVAKAVKSNTTAGRNGACTLYTDAFDPQSQFMLMLQNVRTAPEKQIRDIHFAFSAHILLAQKSAGLTPEDRQVFLFNTFTAPDLYEAVFSADVKRFMDLYAKYEADPNFKKVYVDSRKLTNLYMTQAYEVGTNYFFNPVEANRHTPFFETVYTSNLCTEVMQPTFEYLSMKELYSTTDVGYMMFECTEGISYHLTWSARVTINGKIGFAGQIKEGDVVKTEGSEEKAVQVAKIVDFAKEPEVAICALGGIVYYNHTDDEDYYKSCEYALRMIDKCIHLSNYPLPHIGFTAKQRLSAGLGLLGAATQLARKGFRYDSQEGRDEIHRMSERHSYFAIRAALNLGIEKGNAPWIHKTKWPQGWLPIDTYKKSIDKFVTVGLQYDWEDLRAGIIANGGIRFSTVVNHMPTESSSKRSGCPNSWYPIRSKGMKKSDSGHVVDWGAVDNDIIGDQYQLAWDVKPVDMIIDYGIIQKFADGGVSGDTYRDRSDVLEIETKDYQEEFMMMYVAGMKSRYYAHTYISAKRKKANDATLVNKAQAVSAENTPDFGLFAEGQEFNSADSADSGCAGGFCTL